MIRSTLLRSLLAFAACFGSLSAQTPSTVITFREGTNFTPRGINSHGQIVGDYTPIAGGPARGFLRSPNGALQIIQAPNTTGDTRLNGINDLGEIAGAAGPSDTSRAFLRAANGDFQEIHYSLSASSTARALNNTGFVVGSYRPFDFAHRAFFRDLAGGFITLGEIFQSDVSAIAIANTTNRILLLQTSPGSGLSLGSHISTDSGSFSPLWFQLTSQFSSSGRVAGINAGHLVTGSSGSSGFLARIARPAAFGETIVTDGAYFGLPNASETTPTGINDRNQIIGTATIGGQPTGFLLNLCSPALPVTTRTHGAAAEAAVIELQRPEGFCLWAADTDVPWISFTRSVGNGSGFVAYTLQRNSTSAQRTGRITIGSSQFVVTQASGDCQYTVSPNSPSNVQAQGATINFSVLTSPACPWTAYSPASWARILDPGDGNTTGTGTATVTVDAFPADGTATRTTTINVAGTLLTLTQAPPPCTLQIARTSFTASAGGSVEGFHINTRTACSWTADAVNTPWITSSSFNAVHTGPNTLPVRIAPNPGPTERTGTIRVSIPAPQGSTGPSVTISIRQSAGAACTYSLSPASATISGTSDLPNGFDVIAGSTCPFTVTIEAPWIQNVERSGSRVSYNAAPNTTRFPRRGLIRVNNDLVFIVDQLGNPDTQLAFVPLHRCRVLDTRPGSTFTGDQGPSALAGGFTRTLALSGRCNVPASARAVALHVTALPLVSLAYLTIHPSNTGRPLASTLNSWDGRTVANLVIVPGLHLSFYPTDYTNLVADVLGYFTAPVPESAVLYPVTPCRLLDTRAAGNSPIPANATRTIPINGQCGIPAHATALSLNVTAIPRSTTLDSLTVYPAGQNRPAPAPLNAAPGRIVSTATLIPHGAAGSLTIHASQEADVVIDVNAYFSTPSDSGLYFTPRTPCRIVDTRFQTGTSEGSLTASITRTFAPATAVPQCGIPAEARAHLVNATVVPDGPTAFLSLFPSPTWTGSSTLNAYDGQVTANLAIVPDNGQGIGALASNPTHLVLDSSGYFTTLPVELRRPVPIPLLSPPEQQQ